MTSVPLGNRSRTAINLVEVIAESFGLKENRWTRPRWTIDFLENQVRTGLPAGGRRIRTLGPPRHASHLSSRPDLYGTFLGCRFGIPELIKAGGGSVINMSSNVALMGVAGRDCYTAAKGGIAAITRSLANAYAAKSSRQCYCAIGDDDRAGQEADRRKCRSDSACGLPSARPDRTRRYRQHGALSR
jgi:NAD(P)-dependent dehydrogenase (short-subunit alcohol dehydrogenase family)